MEGEYPGGEKGKLYVCIFADLLAAVKWEKLVKSFHFIRSRSGIRNNLEGGFVFKGSREEYECTYLLDVSTASTNYKIK